jgi:hypothetical protein
MGVCLGVCAVGAQTLVDGQPIDKRLPEKADDRLPEQLVVLSPPKKGRSRTIKGPPGDIGG